MKIENEEDIDFSIYFIKDCYSSDYFKNKYIYMVFLL